jgi:hypothetical protein
VITHSSSGDSALPLPLRLRAESGPHLQANPLTYCRWQDALDQTLDEKIMAKGLASLRLLVKNLTSAWSLVAGETDSIPSTEICR